LATAATTTFFTQRVDGTLGLGFATSGNRHEALAAFDALLDLRHAKIKTAASLNGVGSAELFEGVEDGLDDVAFVGAAQALGDAVGDTGDFENGADR
jgi:hypothetical protein